ncbi:anti-sigma factor family protein [Nonomuraea cypriaca]|nr:zf-HC2 domain-containing protein [Nonomuraea cypriaca]
MTCEEVRLALGAQALGALEPDEALEVDTHLATCEACGAELVELEGVAAFLGKVSERDVELVTSPPRQVLDRLLNARVKRTRRGRMLLAVAASVAVLAVGGTVWTTVAQTGGQEAASSAQAPRSAADRAPAQESDQEASIKMDDGQGKPPVSKSAKPQRAVEDREFPGENKAEDYRATVSVTPGDGGTELRVHVTGVPVGTTCGIVVIDVDGRRVPTGTWVLSRDVYQDDATFTRRTTLSMTEIARFELVDETGKVLVDIPVRK